jgi:hypothetical protein
MYYWRQSSPLIKLNVCNLIPLCFLIPISYTSYQVKNSHKPAVGILLLIFVAHHLGQAAVREVEENQAVVVAAVGNEVLGGVVVAAVHGYHCRWALGKLVEVLAAVQFVVAAAPTD